MKKLLALLTIVALLTGLACAEDLQVQIIGGEDVPQMTLDLDDMQLGRPTKSMAMRGSRRFRLSSWKNSYNTMLVLLAIILRMERIILKYAMQLTPTMVIMNI